MAVNPKFSHLLKMKGMSDDEWNQYIKAFIVQKANKVLAEKCNRLNATTRPPLRVHRKLTTCRVQDKPIASRTYVNPAALERIQRKRAQYIQYGRDLAAKKLQEYHAGLDSDMETIPVQSQQRRTKQ